MEHSDSDEQETTRISKLVWIAGGVLAAGALAYWITKHTQWGRMLPAKVRQKFPKKDPNRRFGEGTRDIVDEASWESFPASDPPAYH